MTHSTVYQKGSIRINFALLLYGVSLWELSVFR